MNIQLSSLMRGKYLICIKNELALASNSFKINTQDKMRLHNVETRNLQKILNLISFKTQNLKAQKLSQKLSKDNKHISIQI